MEMRTDFIEKPRGASIDENAGKRQSGKCAQKDKYKAAL